MDQNENNNISNQGANQSQNMYSYNQEQQNSQEIEAGAIRRSLGDKNPNAIPNFPPQNISINNDGGEINQNSIVINIDQSPPLYWMFFLIVGIIQIIIIVFLANYYDWDKYNKPSTYDDEDNSEAKER